MDTHRKWNEKRERWEYYVWTQCSHCKKTIEYNSTNMIKNRTRFCCRDCKDDYHLKRKDPTGWNLMNITDSDKMAYFVGLLCSDGYIFHPGSSTSTKGYIAGIELHIKDRELLEKIQHEFGGRLDTIKRNTNIKWHISHKKFITYLMNIGVVPRKTFALNVNTWFCSLSTERKWHFLRGVYDGDGCISLSNAPAAFICGCSPFFLEMIRDFLIQQECQVNYYTKPCKNGQIYSCTFYGSHIEKFLDCIYNRKNIYMKRKYEVYKTYKKMIREKKC